MPITNTEKVALEEALAAFSPADSAAVAQLLYETLQVAKYSKGNVDGLGSAAITSLGRLIEDKSGWDMIGQVEAAITAAIRLPLIKSCDIVFRGRMADVLPRLPAPQKELLGLLLSKMEDIELVHLTRLLYETVAQTPFEDREHMYAFGKLYYSGYSWAELVNPPDPTFKQNIHKFIIGPIISSCHWYLREKLPNVFKVVEEAPAPAPTPPDVTEQAEALPTTTEAAPTQDPTSTDDVEPMPLPEEVTGQEPSFASSEEIAAREARTHQRVTRRRPPAPTSTPTSAQPPAPVSPPEAASDVNGQPDKHKGESDTPVPGEVET
jgi:hypothetical protein